LVSGKTLRVVEIEDVSQVIIMGDGMEPVSCAHETPGRAIVTAHVGDNNFKETLTSLGMKPVEVQFMR
jgi:hypothetical protein